MGQDAAKSFAFLHKVNVRSFSSGRRMWFPAERGGATYTVGVECVEAPLTAKTVEDSGLATMPDDGIVLHATRSQMPFEPRPDDLFTLGKAAGTGRKYRIMSATGAEDRYPHYRIVCERQQ